MKKFLKIFLTILLIFIIFFLYGRFIETSGLEVKEIKIESSNLPTSFHGLKIVHFSDLHYGRIISKKQITNIVNKINELKPDIIVFTGDLFDRDSKITEENLNFLKTSLANLDASIGKYAIYGNHDYEVGLENLVQVYNDSNFIILNNTNDLIYNESDFIFIGGVDDILKGTPDINKVLDNDNISKTYKIILVHEPDLTTDILASDNSINLILAGHSHNGQVKLPFYGAIYTPEGSKKYYDEHYLIDETHLYISSGIGVSGINIRLFNKPSINFYRLYSVQN